MKNSYIVPPPPPPPHLLEIYDASTVSYAENKCSTYQRYASALFSASSLYLHRLFSKVQEAQKTHECCWLRSESNVHCTNANVSVGAFYMLRAPASPISKRHFRAATDGGGSPQNRVCATNSQLKNTQRRIFFYKVSSIFTYIKSG